MNEQPKDNNIGWVKELKHRREVMGYSLTTASEATGISKPVIAAIEADGGQGLPSLYRQKYLKKYASFLGVDVPMDGVIDLESAEPLKSLDRLGLVHGRRLKFQRSINWARYLLVSVLIVPPLVWIAVSQTSLLVTAGLSEDNLLGDTPSVEVRQIRASQLSARPMSLPVNAQPVGADSTVTTTAQPSQNTAPEVPQRHWLTISLTRDSWIEVRDAKGQRLEHDLLRAETQRAYEGQPPFELLVGMAESVRLELNGQPVDHLVGVRDSAEGRSQNQMGVMAFRVHADGWVEFLP